jgi:hypothetical protein
LKLPSSATNTDCRNYFPDLPSLPYGWTYVCSKNPTSTDGTGWLPINFQNYMLYSISNLPLDPFNNSTYYYAFVASGTDFILYTMLEDPKNQASKNDGDNYPHLYSVGTNKRLIDKTQGLVGYWSFDEGTGTIAYDYSGNGNNGTLVNFNFTATSGWTTGKIGGALSFDGVDDYVRILNTSSLQITSDLTILFWMRPTNISKGRQNPLGKAYGGEYMFTLETNGNLSFYQGSCGGNCSPYGYNSNAPYRMSNNNFYFVGIRRKISTQRMDHFKDGVKIPDGSYSWVNPSISTRNLQIGSEYAGFYQGLIDEVRIYNRALSDIEIKALYDATK